MKISKVNGLWIVRVGMCEYTSRRSVGEALKLAGWL